MRDKIRTTTHPSRLWIRSSVFQSAPVYRENAHIATDTNMVPATRSLRYSARAFEVIGSYRRNHWKRGVCSDPVLSSQQPAHCVQSDLT